MESQMRSLILATMLILPAALFAQQPAPAPAPPTPEQQLDKLQARFNDFAQLKRYAADNQKIGDPAPDTQRVVFYGDSLTDNWGRRFGKFFPGKPYVNRGISGQTTPQMLIRFQQDVVHLKPAAVVILAGTNDLAQNTGPESPEMIHDNFRSMVAIAKANHIRVVISSVLPADHFPWHAGLTPAAEIVELNKWLVDFCKAEHLVYLDYYPALATPEGAMKPELAVDKAVHPNDAGYALMEPLAEVAVAKSLAQPAP
jgi:lysophospholipase L1-like esterase